MSSGRTPAGPRTTSGARPGARSQRPFRNRVMPLFRSAEAADRPRGITSAVALGELIATEFVRGWSRRSAEAPAPRSRSWSRFPPRAGSRRSWRPAGSAGRTRSAGAGRRRMTLPPDHGVPDGATRTHGGPWPPSRSGRRRLNQRCQPSPREPGRRIRPGPSPDAGSIPRRPHRRQHSAGPVRTGRAL